MADLSDPKLSLGNQELVSCDTTDNGCGGGSMDNAFKWVQEHGLTTVAWDGDKLTVYASLQMPNYNISGMPLTLLSPRLKIYGAVTLIIRKYLNYTRLFCNATDK